MGYLKAKSITQPKRLNEMKNLGMKKFLRKRGYGRSVNQMKITKLFIWYRFECKRKFSHLEQQFIR